MGEPSRPIDFSAFIDSIGNIELTDWQRQILADLPAGTLSLAGAWDTPRQHGAGPTVTGRMFYKGRARWVLRPCRWQPFERRHHAQPENLSRLAAQDYVRLREMTTAEILQLYRTWLTTARRRSSMRSAYRARSRKRVRRG